MQTDRTELLNCIARLETELKQERAARQLDDIELMKAREAQRRAELALKQIALTAAEWVIK